MLLSQGRERAPCGDVPLRGWGLQLLLGTEVVLEPDVGLQFDVIFGSGGPEVWSVLLSKFPEPLHLQGASSNFLVWRIKAHKTIRVSHASWQGCQTRGHTILAVAFKGPKQLQDCLDVTTPQLLRS